MNKNTIDIHYYLLKFIYFVDLKSLFFVNKYWNNLIQSTNFYDKIKKNKSFFPNDKYLFLVDDLLFVNIYIKHCTYVNGYLRWYLKNGCNKKIIKLFFKHGAIIDKISYTILLTNATNKNNIESVKYALDNKAEISYENIRCAVQNNYHDIVKLFNKNVDFKQIIDSPIKYANTVKMIQMLEIMKCDISIYNNYLLRHSAASGNLEIVKYLHEKRNIPLYCFPNSAIVLACENGQKEVVKYLLKKNVDTHIENDNAFKYALYNNHFDIVYMLYKHKSKN